MRTSSQGRRGSSIRAVRRLAVTAVGGVLLLAGLAALVLPGPGMLLCILGLVVLASEWDWADRRLQWARRLSQQSIEHGAASRVASYGSVAAGLVFVGLGIAELAVGLPLLTSLTAATLLLSGTVIVGTTTWSRRQHLRSLRDDRRSRPATAVDLTSERV
jgi:hypothetical protein